MKKLLRALALLFVPILLYYACIFLPLEPNNYFGLRAETNTGVIFVALREYKESPTSTVILGDSRMAHFNREQLAALGGGSVTNLAFGGASLKEELDELEWLLAHYGDTIEDVIFGLSFYTLNESYGADRWQSILNSIKNPLLYLTNLSFNMEAVQNLFDTLAGKPLGGGDIETMNPADYEWIDYTVPATGETVTLRKNVAEHLAAVETYLGSWQLNEDELARLVKTILQCQLQGIRFTVVLPPLHPALREYGIEPYGIDAAMQPALELLNDTGALVLDYEFASPPDYGEDMYYDSLHLDYVRGLPVWLDTLFADMAEGA